MNLKGMNLKDFATEDQQNKIFDFLDRMYIKPDESCKKISSTDYELFYKVITGSNDYHDAEEFIKELYKNDLYKQEYIALYSGMKKHKDFIEKYSDS